MTFRPIVRLAGCVTLTLLLAACVPPPTPAPPPVAAPAPPPAAAPLPPPVAQAVVSELPANWADQPRTEGDWLYRQSGADSAATFIGGNGQNLLVLTCSGATRQVTLARLGAGLVQGAGFDVRSETASRTGQAMPVAGNPGWSLAATDSLLDAIAFSKGHFAVGVTGAEPLYPPSYPEISRVIEDCR